MKEPFVAAWPAVPASVPVARHAVTGFLRTAEMSDPPLSDVRLAVSEAVTNVVHHAYRDDPGEVRVRVEVFEDELELIVEDDGDGMRPRPDSPGLGLGLPLIATVADRFDTRAQPGGGTRLCMRFRRGPASATLTD